MHRILLTFLVCLSASGTEKEITLNVQMNHTIQVKNLARVAVGDGKVLKVKALPPSHLLMTAMKPGTTMVRAWNASGFEEVYRVTVTGSPVEREGVVKVALEFLELDMALGRSSGIRWPDTIQFAGVSSLQGDAASSGLNYAVSFSTAKGWINHLIQEGWAHIVANPDLYVRLGEEASFHSGGEFPVSTSSEAYGRFHRHIEWKTYGITAKVKPTSPDLLHISSDINLEISEMNASTAIEGVPGVTRRKLATKMNSIDGETVILSGLVRQTSMADKESLPVLGSIPLIGGLLFGKRTQRADETELLMAVTFSMTTRAREKESLEVFKRRIHSPEAP